MNEDILGFAGKVQEKEGTVPYKYATQTSLANKLANLPPWHTPKVWNWKVQHGFPFDSLHIALFL